jgi:hypothetical protein
VIATRTISDRPISQNGTTERGRKQNIASAPWKINCNSAPARMSIRKIEDLVE